MTLPVEVLGRSGTNRTERGRLYAARCGRQCSMISASVAVAPGLSWVDGRLGHEPPFPGPVPRYRHLAVRQPACQGLRALPAQVGALEVLVLQQIRGPPLEDDLPGGQD